MVSTWSTPLRKHLQVFEAGSLPCPHLVVKITVTVVATYRTRLMTTIGKHKHMNFVYNLKLGATRDQKTYYSFNTGLL